VDDYLSEQEQWEEVKGWVREGLPWFIGAVVVVAGAWSGWKAWQSHREGQYAAAAAQYEQLVRALDRNDEPQAASLADQLVRDYAGSGYADQAQLALARLQVERNELAPALERLQKVLAGTKDAELRPLVRLRIARLQLQQGQADATLATLAAGGSDLGAFAPRYAELRGDALLAKGDREGALKAYREAQGDSGAAGAASSAAASQPGNELLALKINDLSHP
jgi:predicted negative regulator of RcsB-dependent stress response